MGAFAAPIAMGISSWIGGRAGRGGGGGGSKSQERDALNEAMLSARESRSQGGSLFNTGAPLLQAASGYWQRLLNGDKRSLMEATQPERSAIEESALGAERAITAGPLRGGARDYAQAELNRTKFSKLGDLIPGARRAAAEGGSALGLNTANAGVQATNAGGGLFSSLYGQQARTRQVDQERKDGFMEEFGGLLSNTLAGLVKGAGQQAQGGRIPSIGGGGGGGGFFNPKDAFAGVKF